ncbi:hypothetical protein [uncultured Pleomorphomonas sp.]|nr:hypothetical protein [uncultured Pleomorphomonas sp.]
MRQVIDIDRRGSYRGYSALNFVFVVTFINGDSAEYALLYDAEERNFRAEKQGHRPKDRIRLAWLKRQGKQPFTIKVRLADHLKTLLTREEMAACAAMSLEGPKRNSRWPRF